MWSEIHSSTKSRLRMDFAEKKYRTSNVAVCSRKAVCSFLTQDDQNYRMFRIASCKKKETFKSKINYNLYKIN